MFRRVLRQRAKSYIKGEGLTPYTMEDLEEFKRLQVVPHGEDILIKLKPEMEDGDFKLDVKPAIDIIKDYVKFYMLRYGVEHSQVNVERGLWVEKAFDLLLQTFGIPKDYAEPTRDWRQLKPCEFYVPLIGKLEVKSTTSYQGILKFTVNIENWRREQPDYAVVLNPIDWTGERVWIKLMGAMPRNQVESYMDKTDYHIKMPDPKDSFWAIPCADITVKPIALYNTLMAVKARLHRCRRIRLQ